MTIIVVVSEIPNEPCALGINVDLRMHLQYKVIVSSGTTVQSILIMAIDQRPSSLYCLYRGLGLDVRAGNLFNWREENNVYFMRRDLN